MENLTKKEGMSKTKKILIGIGVFVVLIIVIGIFSDPAKETKATVQPSSPTETSQEWKVVYTFKGNGIKKSPLFELNGNESRLKYSYKSTDKSGMGMFAAYVVDAGQDILKDGGVPEVMVDKTSDQGETSLQKSAGRYYLNISASGEWEVIVEEK